MVSESSSLKAFDRLADRIRLHRQARKTPVIVVEGPSDLAFNKRITDAEWDIFVAGTREAVIEAAAQLHQYGVAAAVGLVDRDFDDGYAQASISGAPLVAYDGADLESMLFMSSALRHVLEEFGSEQKIAKAGGHAAIRDKVVATVRPMSYLRRNNAIHQWGIAFDAIDVADRIKVQKPELAIRPLIDALLRASPEATVARGELETIVGREELLKCPDSGLPMFRGRDALAVLGVLLRREIGNCSQHQCHNEHLAKVLRLAADPQAIRELPWYSRLAAWLEISLSSVSGPSLRAT